MKPTRALSIVRKLVPDVTVVKDATRGLSIEVAKRDQRAQGRRKHKDCALAVACRRTMKLDAVIVSMSRVYLIKNTVATRYEFPPSVAREIVSFDRGGGFGVGTYALNKISHGHKQRRRGGDGGKHTGTRAPARHLTAGVRVALA